jgi:hypothetical protein
MRKDKTTESELPAGAEADSKIPKSPIFLKLVIPSERSSQQNTEFRALKRFLKFCFITTNINNLRKWSVRSSADCLVLL